MSRNSTGTYTLPSGNPVVTGTLIESNWANNTLSDLATAMTDSLSRSGQGGMTFAMRGVDGTVTVPAYSFTAETSSGFYRAGAGDIRLSILGTDRVTVTASTFTFAGALSLTGNATVGGTLGVTGNTTLGGTLGVTGNTTLSGTLGVTGATTLTGTLTTNGQLALNNDYVEKVYTANTGSAITLDLANGTEQILTLNSASVTITMPTAVAGKSFVIFLKQDATGSRTVTWTTVKWPGGTAPTITATASKQDIYSFFSDGTNWYGVTVGQNYTP